MICLEETTYIIVKMVNKAKYSAPLKNVMSAYPEQNSSTIQHARTNIPIHKQRLKRKNRYGPRLRLQIALRDRSGQQRRPTQW
jgi:hypothetical protein